MSNPELAELEQRVIETAIAFRRNFQELQQLRDAVDALVKARKCLEEKQDS